MHSSLQRLTIPVNATTGRDLRKRLRGKPPAERAKVAAILTTEHIAGLLPSQTARLCKANAASVGKVLGRAPRRRTDAQLDRFVAQVGIERVWEALDRATQPPFPGE